MLEMQHALVRLLSDQGISDAEVCRRLSIQWVLGALSLGVKQLVR